MIFGYVDFRRKAGYPLIRIPDRITTRDKILSLIIFPIMFGSTLCLIFDVVVVIRFGTNFYIQPDTDFDIRLDTDFEIRLDTDFDFRSDTEVDIRSDTNFDSRRSDTDFDVRSDIKKTLYPAGSDIQSIPRHNPTYQIPGPTET